MCGVLRPQADSPCASGAIAYDSACCRESAHNAVFAVGALQPANDVLCAVRAVVVDHDNLKVLLAAAARSLGPQVMRFVRIMWRQTVQTTS